MCVGLLQGEASCLVGRCCLLTQSISCEKGFKNINICKCHECYGQFLENMLLSPELIRGGAPNSIQNYEKQFPDKIHNVLFFYIFVSEYYFQSGARHDAILWVLLRYCRSIAGYWVSKTGGALSGRGVEAGRGVLHARKVAQLENPNLLK